ncbi:MAG TPA: Na+/H+ antiporter subunit E [Candidatus Binatia bacterium]|nr:Na+/H+ antiporter subunit E [Candidatus Binatia bacterium]
MFLWHILLALSWAAITGLFSWSNVLAGFILAYLALFIAQRAIGSYTYFRRIDRVLRFAVFYVWELILANLRVAYDVMTPRHRIRPGVVAIPLDAKTDAEITLLANLITLTPGSVSLDVSSDRRFLYLHAMYIDDVEEFRQSIKDTLERRVLEVLR